MKKSWRDKIKEYSVEPKTAPFSDIARMAHELNGLYLRNEYVVRCGTCGSACRIYHSNDGTSGYLPILPYEVKND